MVPVSASLFRDLSAITVRYLRRNRQPKIMDKPTQHSNAEA